MVFLLPLTAPEGEIEYEIVPQDSTVLSIRIAVQYASLTVGDVFKANQFCSSS